MTAIRHIASQFARDDLFLTAEFEQRVRLWSLAERRRVAEIDTVLSFGGHRLALCGTSRAPIVVAGAWEQHGICAYDGLSGDLLWQRKDLKKSQHLAPAGEGALVTACFDDKPLHGLEAATGETIVKINGVRSFHQSGFDPFALTSSAGRVGLLDMSVWRHTWRTKVDGFAVLDFAFSPDSLVASDVVEGGSGSIYCFDLGGQPLWRWKNAPETNCRSIAWDQLSTQWVAVAHHVNHERPDTLVRLSVDGSVVNKIPLGLLGDFEILPSGRYVVGGTGQVLDSESGKSVWDLPV